MELSLRPSSTFVISDHLLLTDWWSMTRIQSSSTVQFDFFRRGFNWLCQRSRHYFPDLNDIDWAMCSHWWGPMSAIILSSYISYSSSQALLFDLTPCCLLVAIGASNFWPLPNIWAFLLSLCAIYSSCTFDISFELYNSYCNKNEIFKNKHE